MSGRRSILLLGGSSQQVVAIERAHSLGYRTVLCDYLPDNPGQHVADVFYLVSTTNREAVLEVARQEGVSGVLAYASDPAAPTAAYVAQEMNLAGNPLESVETLSEKHRFRAHLRKIGLPCPNFAEIPVDASGGEAAGLLGDLTFPIVLKPTDSSGSKGVTVVKEAGSLESALAEARAHSRNGVLIGEEFIERSYPNVIGGDVFVVGGEIQFWGLMDCLREARSDGMVPVGEMLPCSLDLMALGRVKSVLQKLVSSLEIVGGELNVEVIIGRSGEPYILELGARAGGNMIPVQLSDASGCDLIASNVLCAMGENPLVPAWDASTSGAVCAHVVLHAREAGRFHSVGYGKLDQYVYREVLYKKPGDHVDAFMDAGNAIGIAFMKFPDAELMRERLFGNSESLCMEVE